MRSIGWMALVVLILIAAYLCVPVSRASRKEAKKPRPAAVLVEDDDRMVVGYGRTADAARDRALDKARNRVLKLLEKRFDMSDWEPRPEQLDPDYLVRFGVVQPDGEPEPGPLVGDEKGMVARYTVELTPEYLREVQRVARLEWVENRHLLLARILAGAVALLLVTAGYLRLEEVTRGYATHLLRFAAIALLTIVAAGLYLM